MRDHRVLCRGNRGLVQLVQAPELKHKSRTLDGFANNPEGSARPGIALL